MKRIFTILLIAMLATQPAFARHNHSWHHQDWLGLGIFSGIAALTVATIASEPAPIVRETVVVAQPQPVVVASPTPVVVQQPVVVSQPVVQTTVIHAVPPPPPIVVRPIPPPPPPAHFFRPTPPPRHFPRRPWRRR